MLIFCLISRSWQSSVVKDKLKYGLQSLIIFSGIP